MLVQRSTQPLRENGREGFFDGNLKEYRAYLKEYRACLIESNVLDLGAKT